MLIYTHHSEEVMQTFPNYIFFNCPKCYGRGTTTDNQFGDELKCSECEGKGVISFDKAIKGLDESKKKEALKQIGKLVPMQSVNLEHGVKVIVTTLWLTRLLDWVEKH
jgi:RecJ-like exonuclease